MTRHVGDAPPKACSGAALEELDDFLTSDAEVQLLLTEVAEPQFYGVAVLDAQGRVFSGHNGGNTRGFHYMPGAYLQKGFDKHGPLSNPYAYGYFPAMPHPDVDRFHVKTLDQAGFDGSPRLLPASWLDADDQAA